MIYSVLTQDFSYENIKLRSIRRGSVILNVIDNGNGEGEIFNIYSPHLKDYLNPRYNPGTKIKI